MADSIQRQIGRYLTRTCATTPGVQEGYYAQPFDFAKTRLPAVWGYCGPQQYEYDATNRVFVTMLFFATLVFKFGDGQLFEVGDAYLPALYRVVTTDQDERDPEQLGLQFEALPQAAVVQEIPDEHGLGAVVMTLQVKFDHDWLNPYSQLVSG